MANSSEGFPRKTALITGASSGIGYELAKLFAKDGYQLVLIARSEEALASLAKTLQTSDGASVTILPIDLSRPAAAEEIVGALRQQDLHVDVLVNNAGFGVYGPFARTSSAEELEMIQVNVTSLTHLTKLLLPDMIARRGGHILNVASTAAFQPGPLMAVYYATKAYVLSWSEALTEELRGSGVWVTVLCPGPTETNFHLRARVTHSQLFRRGVMDAAAVARAGYRGLMRRQTIVIPGFRNQLLATAVRWLPREFVSRLVKRIQERRLPIP